MRGSREKVPGVLDARESKKAPPDMWTGRSMRACLSREVPIDHEARSQVKVKEKSSAARVKALRKSLKRSRQNSKAWERPPACVTIRTQVACDRHV